MFFDQTYFVSYKPQSGDLHSKNVVWVVTLRIKKVVEHFPNSGFRKKWSIHDKKSRYKMSKFWVKENDHLLSETHDE